jgi:hypothetical protein
MMESSVKSISRPVIDRLPVNSLDEFACRQLDRVRAIRLISVFYSSLSLLFLFVTFAPTPLRIIRVRVLIFSFQLGRYGAGTRRPSSADADERSASVGRQRKRGRSSRESGSQIRDVSMERNSAERDPSPGGQFD